MTEVIRKIPEPEVGDEADQPPLYLAEGVLSAAGLPPIEDEGPEPAPEPIREATAKPLEGPQTSLDGKSVEAVMAMAAGRGLPPQPRSS